ncbi:MAG: hypothetical protein RIT27_2209 [Pseudomonadota bacterium]|jgi:hypothetical protein
MLNKSLLQFIFTVLLWLPVCFAIWFLTASIHSHLITFALSFSSEWTTLHQIGYTIEVIPRFSPSSYINLQLTVNPLLYGYGVPFLAALCFSSSGNWEKRLGVFLMGYFVILLPIQLFGSWISLWKTLIFDFNAPSFFKPEIIALFYQLSSLILPPVAPLVIWLWGFQDDWQNFDAKT